MTSPEPFETKTSYFSRVSKKRWLGLALALSLTLHIGAALLIIITGSFGINGTSSTKFVIQNVDLAPSISAPEKKAAALPDLPDEMASNPPATEPEAAIPAQKKPSGQASESADGADRKAILSTPLGLGMTHGYFSGLADGRTLREDIRSYYFEMVEKINRQWWEKAELLKEPLRQDGVFELLIQRDGTIVSIRILQGSGSREADRLLMEIIRNSSPLPPLPPSYNLNLFQAPLKIKAPSFLFRLTN